MKNRKGAHYLSADDLAVLQAHFDALLGKHELSRDSQEAELLAAGCVPTLNLPMGT